MTMANFNAASHSLPNHASAPDVLHLGKTGAGTLGGSNLNAVVAIPGSMLERAPAAVVSAPAVIREERIPALPPLELDALNDAMLFTRVAGGDRDALALLVGRYERPLFGLLHQLTGDPHRADDLFQETFLRAVRSAGTFDEQKSFKAWISTIALNLVRDDARNRKRRSEVQLGEDGEVPPAQNGSSSTRLNRVSREEDPQTSALRADESRIVRGAMTHLTAKEREVVLLHFFNSMTLAEAADSLQVPLGTVKSRLHGALMRLKNLLKP